MIFHFNILIPSTGLHWPQKSHVLQTSTETQQKASLMDVISCWLWSKTHPCAWEQTLCPWCPLPMTWSHPQDWQWQQRSHPPPPSLFVNLIDTELNKKIVNSSKKDPLLLNALQALEGEVPTQFRSCLSDWSYDAGILTYQGQVFLPDWDNIRHDIVKLHHNNPTARHPSYLKTQLQDIGGLDWPNTSENT